MTAQIDITQPPQGAPTTAAVRENFKRARDAIAELVTATATLNSNGTSMAAQIASIAANAGPQAVTTLTANRTYYVRADGDDANDGLTDTAGGAFRSLTKATNTASKLLLDAWQIFIRVGPGTFASAPIRAIAASTTGGRSMEIIGSGKGVTIFGPLTVGANTWVEASECSAAFCSASNSGTLTLYNVRTQNVSAYTSGWVTTEPVEFTGNGAFAARATQGGIVELIEFSFLANPNYTWAIVAADMHGRVMIYNAGTGTPTGKKFDVAQGGIINTYGVGLAAIPGTVAGTAAASSGGYYN